VNAIHSPSTIVAALDRRFSVVTRMFSSICSGEGCILDDDETVKVHSSGYSRRPNETSVVVRTSGTRRTK
jgi:hypothetical protein